MKIKRILLLLFNCFALHTHGIENPHDYPVELYELAYQLQCDTGVVVIAYNRPDYFQKVVDALEKNREAHYLPFVFILDGGPNATQAENIEIIKHANIKHKYIFAHPTNYGCGKTLIDSRRLMFEWCKFEKILFFEDDLVVSPEYITVTLNLYDYVQKNYTNVGIVQAFNRSFIPKDKLHKYAHNIIETYRHYWGYCIDSKTYFAIKDIMEEHEKNHLDNSYKTANNQAIADWISNKLKLKRKYLQKKLKSSLKSTIDWEGFLNEIISIMKKKPPFIRSGQDYEMRLALFLSGIIKLNTVISRAQYIGAVGSSNSQKTYDKLGYGYAAQLVSELDNKNGFKWTPSAHNLAINFIYHDKLRLPNNLKRLIDILHESGFHINLLNKQVKNFYYKQKTNDCFEKKVYSILYTKHYKIINQFVPSKPLSFIYADTKKLVDLIIKHKALIKAKFNGIIIPQNLGLELLIETFGKHFCIEEYKICEVLMELAVEN